MEGHRLDYHSIWTHAVCLTWPDWANLLHCERPSIPVTKELRRAHASLLTLSSVLGPSACSNPDPINDHTGGSISQALGCQMWYGITLPGWRKGGRIASKRFGSSYQQNHSNHNSDWCARWWEGRRSICSLSFVLTGVDWLICLLHMEFVVVVIICEMCCLHLWSFHPFFLSCSKKKKSI